MTGHRRPEALRLAVDLYARRDLADGEAVLHAADVFSDWLATCPPQLPAIGEQIMTALSAILSNQENMMSTQDDINAAVAADTSLLTDLSTQVTAVQAAQAAFAAEITALEGAGVDTTGLVAASAQLAAAQAPLDAAVAALTAAATPAPPAAATGVSN